MTSGERAWTVRMIAQWGGMAAQTRRIACGRESALNRAGALEEVVARLQARLDAEAPDRAPVAIGAQVVRGISIARQAHLAEMAAYRAQRAAGGPVRPPRRNFFREMAECSGDRGSRRGGPAQPAPLSIAPPPIAAPFVAGPQMSFEL